MLPYTTAFLSELLTVFKKALCQYGLKSVPILKRLYLKSLPHLNFQLGKLPLGFGELFLLLFKLNIKGLHLIKIIMVENS
jgi:hypothetical protein